MKRYVLQFKRFNWDPWEIWPGAEFDTLAEAKAAFAALPIKTGFRIAESYTVVRYKAVKV